MVPRDCLEAPRGCDIMELHLAIKLRRHVTLLAFVISVLLFATVMVRAADGELLLASTTSTENSGLFAHILPIFEAQSHIKTRVIAVGTGQALRLGRNGDADVLLVHDTEAETAFVADGYGVDRRPVMFNDFVLLGPRADPAKISGGSDAIMALRAIAKVDAIFISRGDDSGTHRLERRLWSVAGVKVEEASGHWYREAGAGMGAALNIASSVGGYILCDRATWLSFRNKGNLKVLVAGDVKLFNQYSVVRVNPARHPHVNARAASKFVDWLVSPAGQSAIRRFGPDDRPLFFPNASGRRSSDLQR